MVTAASGTVDVRRQVSPAGVEVEVPPEPLDGQLDLERTGV